MASRFVVASSTKKDGNMSFVFGERDAVQINRDAFLAVHGLRWSECAVMIVEHGEKILSVSEPVREPTQALSCEALMTNVRGLALFLLTADCFPVAYYDPMKGTIALAHCGWRPTDKGLSTKVVARMGEEYDCNPRDIEVHIGPGVRKESYVVEEVVQKDDFRWQPYLEKAGEGKTRVDLVGFIKTQLLGAGILPEKIFDSGVDTVPNPNYFSHYRAVRTKEPEGRLATIAVLL